MNNLKIRCSQIGKIMTGTLGLTDNQEKELKRLKTKKTPLTDRQKGIVKDFEYKRDNPELSKTTISYLAELETEARTGRRKEITTKQMEKGIFAEEESITLLCEVTGNFYVKNEQHFENDWLTGTPDIVTEVVRDVKTSWDVFTFPHRWTYTLDPGYEYQLQGYLDLTGLDTAYLDYCLVDAPDFLIEKEKKYMMYNQNIPASEMDRMLEKVERNMRYEDIPSEDRVFTIEIKRDDKIINEIHHRVELCRKFIGDNL